MDLEAPTCITRSTSPMSMPSLERGRSDQRLELSSLEALLGVAPTIGAEKAPVVTGHVLCAKAAWPQPRRDALGLLARVDEDERGPVLAHERRHTLVDFLPDFVRADRAQR